MPTSSNQTIFRTLPGELLKDYTAGPGSKMMQSAQILRNMKQMIIINAVLKLPKEKLVAHIFQASVGAFIEAAKADRKTWLKEGRPKIILKALSEDDFQDLLLKAERRKLPIFRVEDVDASPTSGIACVGIGPVCDTQIEQLTMVFDFYGWVRQNALNARPVGW